MTPVEVLDKAADLIQELGLAKGDYQDAKGRVCMVGAINLAACGNADPAMTLSHPAHRIARTAQDCLFQFIPAPYLTTNYNDRPSTTKAKAVALLHKAAKECK